MTLTLNGYELCTNNGIDYLIVDHHYDGGKVIFTGYKEECQDVLEDLINKRDIEHDWLKSLGYTVKDSFFTGEQTIKWFGGEL